MTRPDRLTCEEMFRRLDEYMDRELNEVEAAMWRSYNRWIAQACAPSNGRLRWVCRVPLTNMEDACAELRFAKEHGACGVFLRSIEGDRFLSDPFFFPLYEEASALDMPVCVHVSFTQMLSQL